MEQVMESVLGQIQELRKGLDRASGSVTLAPGALQIGLLLLLLLLL